MDCITAIIQLQVGWRGTESWEHLDFGPQRVFDLHGGEVCVLVSKAQSEGWHSVRWDGRDAAVCLLSVLALGPLRAVLIAFLLSTIDVIRRASRPDTSALLKAPDGSHFIPAGIDDAVSSSGLIVYRFGAPLYFANAALFLDEVEELLARATTPVRWFVLDAQAIVDIDTTGAGVLKQAITLLSDRDVTFAVSRADRSFRSWLKKYDLMELIDESHFYPTNFHAAEAFREES